MTNPHLPLSESEFDGGATTITTAIDVQADFILELLAKREAAIASNDTHGLKTVERVLKEITLYKTFVAMRVIN